MVTNVKLTNYWKSFGGIQKAALHTSGTNMIFLCFRTQAIIYFYIHLFRSPFWLASYCYYIHWNEQILVKF